MRRATPTITMAAFFTPTLEQARADLGVVVSRSNAGGVHAVEWSLPG